MSDGDLINKMQSLILSQQFLLQKYHKYNEHFNQTLVQIGNYRNGIDIEVTYGIEINDLNRLLFNSEGNLYSDVSVSNFLLMDADNQFVLDDFKGYMNYNGAVYNNYSCGYYNVYVGGFNLKIYSNVLDITKSKYDFNGLQELLTFGDTLIKQGRIDDIMIKFFMSE
jgi:hypothetical protein